MTTKTVWIAGSTRHTEMCAEALAEADTFTITRCITPAPKPVGRKHIIQPNPVHRFAVARGIPVELIGHKIDAECKAHLTTHEPPDILLVVDFGYLVPSWLLGFPRIAPLNIHPSLLPRWRGSSPGQCVLLYGEHESAITLMKMTAGLDEGPIITQLPLPVDPAWTADKYYMAAFSLTAPQLPELITAFCHQLRLQEQPASSPTAVARRFTKEDGFVSWQVLVAAQNGSGTKPSEIDASLWGAALVEAAHSADTIAELCERACRAFSPWPGLWTYIPTDSGERRLKIHTCHTNDAKLVLDLVQVEGKTPVQYTQLNYSKTL